MMFSGAYEDIIRTLGQWRILDLKSLLKKTHYNYSYQAFAKRVKKLEDYGHLDSIYFQSYRKYLYLTSKGLREAGLNDAWSVNKDIIHHDIISVNVFEYFLGLKGVQSGDIYLDRAGAEKRPDCYINLKENKKKIEKMALEVELSQKSYERIEDKFLDYLEKDTYDLILYLFQKTTIFESYKEKLDRVDRHRDPLISRWCRDKMILLIEPEIKHKKFNLMDSICYFEGKIEKFSAIWKQILILENTS